jgi:hypothetical protein
VGICSVCRMFYATGSPTWLHVKINLRALKPDAQTYSTSIVGVGGRCQCFLKGHSDPNAAKPGNGCFLCVTLPTTPKMLWRKVLLLTHFKD